RVVDEQLVSRPRTETGMEVEVNHFAASRNPSTEVFRQSQLSAPGPRPAEEDALRVVVLAGDDRPLHRGQAVFEHLPRAPNPERFEPPRGPAGVQRSVQVRVAGGRAFVLLTGEQEVPVRVDIGFVEPPKVSEPVRVEGVEEDESYGPNV